MTKAMANTDECAYCGMRQASTQDHVPPRSLFSKPRPSNLITVPSCGYCNKGFSKDDEYFQLMIKAGIDRNRFPKENESSLRTINSLSRPESLGYAISLLQNYERNPARHNVDIVRIGRVLHRIVRGIFYHETKIRLADSVNFDFISISDSPSRAATVIDIITGLSGQLESVGDGVFRYAFRQVMPFTLATVWLLTFYDHRKFFCITAPKN
jgi:hypothetical protein